MLPAGDSTALDGVAHMMGDLKHMHDIFVSAEQCALYGVLYCTCMHALYCTAHA